jgi:hypothetical protein
MGPAENKAQGANSAEDKGSVRKGYSKPRLVLLGNVKNLTQGPNSGTLDTGPNMT